MLRDIVIDSNISLIEFSNIISTEFGFDSSEISTFHKTDENWEQLDEIKIFKIDFLRAISLTFFSVGIFWNAAGAFFLSKIGSIPINLMIILILGSRDYIQSFRQV